MKENENPEGAYTFRPIGYFHSCFKEKFGIPRQPGIVENARGQLELLPDHGSPDTVRGLEDFSHIWLLFVFHAVTHRRQRTTVRPPRLGGNRRMGVFATRSGFRPNPIGMSVAELEGISRRQGSLLLHLKGIDLLDGTPVLDVKPYLPYADAVMKATGGFAETEQPPLLRVEFDPEPLRHCMDREAADIPELHRFIVQMLENDPRPAYHRKHPQPKTFGTKVFDLEVRWVVSGDQARVIEIRQQPVPHEPGIIAARKNC
ncbi:MAG: tRNA (N6-threonylcarbamoyladenosine(37)-N6)-methyltransferase TrmO [Thermodesulfobacteriota bacterium]